MINRNFTGNEERAPFLLAPAGKDYLWGGSRLKEEYAKDLDLSPLAETWECSTHPDGPSRVASGRYQGMLLPELLDRHPEYLGSHPRTKGEFPILIKLIDAKQNLSVQVHPDDAYARIREQGQLGKTEMWYVLDAAEDARLVYGLNRKVDKNTLQKSLQEGTVERYLQKVPVKKNDVFYLAAGTIHALGAGTLVAEIQENSNLTYRLYDYDRVDKSGKKRKLQIEKALEVANLEGSNQPVQPMRVLRYRPGCASEFLCRCPYFEVERLLLNTERCREMYSFQTTELSFEVLLCIQGCGALLWGTETLCFFKGDCIFVPAASVPAQIHGAACFLRVRC